MCWGQRGRHLSCLLLVLSYGKTVSTQVRLVFDIFREVANDDTGRLIMLLIYGDLMRSTWLFLFAVISIARGTIYTQSSLCQASGFLVQYGTETSGQYSFSDSTRNSDRVVIYHRLCCSCHGNTQRASGFPAFNSFSERRPVSLQSLHICRRFLHSCSNVQFGLHKSLLGLYVPGRLLFAPFASILVSSCTCLDSEVLDRHHHSRSCRRNLRTRRLRIPGFLQGWT